MNDEAAKIYKKWQPFVNSGNSLFVIPILNVDGSYTIQDTYDKTGELILKRKNNNRENEGNLNCPIATQGVDINRNYGYHWGNTNDACSDSYPGPHAFSEKESQAMRSLL